MTSPQVLIVGGGPVGLTLAIELGQQGVPCELVDKRPELGRLPKMERCNARTMENFRRAGVADQVRAAGLDNELAMDVFICVESVTQPPLVHHRYPSVNELKAVGRAVNDGSMPLEPYQLISQYTLEPLLKSVAERTPGVSVRFGNELADFDEEVDRVVARVRANGGATRIVDADYLVGCDGGSSLVRGKLGIELRGESLLELCQALFYSRDLFERIPIGKGRHYHIADDRSSFLIVQDDTQHFSLHAVVDKDSDMPKLFESIVGMPIDYRTLYVGRWTQRLMIADHYRSGRVFIAGDAAHLMIPTGGLGMNTGAGDAVDLAWKLAGALHGWGGNALLDSYEAERRQIGVRNVAASRKAASGRRTWREAWTPTITEDTSAGDKARQRLAEIADREQRWSNDLYGIELGYRYQDSPLVMPEDGHGPDPANFAYTPTTWPGARVPHLWLGDKTALQDNLRRCYTLLHTRELGHAETELASAFAWRGAPYTTFKVQADARGIETALEGYPLVLLRPDLHVTWRGWELNVDPNVLAEVAIGHRSGSTTA